MVGIQSSSEIRRDPSIRNHTLLSYICLLPVRSVIPLLASFIVAFAVVVILGVYGQRMQLTTRIAKAIPAQNDPIPEAVPVNQSGVVLHVPSVEEMTPTTERDWAYLGWFKFKRPVQQDERIVLLAKYDPHSKVRPGYSFALRGGIDGVRPVVYWQGEHGTGRWFSFAPVQLQTREWYLFAVSFRRGTLGVHVVTASSPKSVMPLGGYDVGAEELPVNTAELIIGSFANGKFRGRMGPQGMVTSKKLTAVYSSLLKQCARSPMSIPTDIEGLAVVFWTDGKRDSGPAQLPVNLTLQGGGRTRPPDRAGTLNSDEETTESETD